MVQTTLEFNGFHSGFRLLLLSMDRSSAALRLCLVVLSRIRPEKKSLDTEDELPLMDDFTIILSARKKKSAG